MMTIPAMTAMHAMIITHGQAVTILWSTVAIAVVGSFLSYFVGRRHGHQDGEISALTVVNRMIADATKEIKIGAEMARRGDEQEVKVICDAMDIFMIEAEKKMDGVMTTVILRYAEMMADAVSAAEDEGATGDVAPVMKDGQPPPLGG